MMNFLKNLAAFAAKAARAIIACLTIVVLCICTAPARAIAWVLRTANRPFEFVRVKYARAKKKLLAWSFSKKKNEPVQVSSDVSRKGTEEALEEIFGDEAKPTTRKRWSWRRKAFCFIIMPITLLFIMAFADEYEYRTRKSAECDRISTCAEEVAEEDLFLQ
jgi:hypothetical protein